MTVARTHRPKIDHADQLGSLCLGGFHRRHGLLRGARIRAETDDTADDGCECANNDGGVKP